MARRLADDKLDLFEEPGTIPAMAKSPSVPWTREHQLIALNLYRKIPFGHYDKGKPIVIQMAGLMGRSPSSLAMKLVNFASLNPLHQARGIKGLDGATKDDRKMWMEFQSNLQTLGPESEQLVHDLFTPDDSLEIDFLDGKTAVPTSIRTCGGLSTEGKATVKVRRGQQFFRQSILNAYGVRCCVSGINVPGLLVASHIRPWKDFPHDRLDPSNGLCLSALHDAAFDTGLMTLDEGFSMVLSPKLRKSLPQESLKRTSVSLRENRSACPTNSPHHPGNSCTTTASIFFDDELYPSDAQWAGMCDRISKPSPQEARRRRAIAERYTQAV